MLAEPVGSVAPKVDVKDRITWLDKPQGQALNLLCPAQSYPMPAYRYQNRPIPFYFGQFSLSILSWFVLLIS